MYTMQTDLDKNGYVLIPNPLSNQHKQNALSCIVNMHDNSTKIDYTRLNNFIDTDLIPNLNETFGWKAKYVKYRFSNMQNSKDASTFHGDIYNFVNDDIMPIYTSIIYFDDAELEIIPGSHLKHNLSTSELYSNKIKIKINAGNMLVFHANMYHRGIFYKSIQPNRRILQVFDIFPNQKTFDELFPKLLTVITDNQGKGFVSNATDFFSKNKYLTDLSTLPHLWLLNNSSQYKILLSDISDEEKKGKYITYLPGRVDTVKPGELQDWNINMTVIPYKTIRPDFTLQTIVLVFIAILIMYFMISMLNLKTKYPILKLVGISKLTSRPKSKPKKK